MKLKYKLEMVNMGNEIIAVPIGENAQQLQGVLKINKEAKEIINLLQMDVSEEEIVTHLAKKYENEYDDLKPLVHKFISRIQELGLLDA